ncbi:hypothetical protein AWB67_07645 [Caballeronia terrestris]|uniref:Uncharacterized protein n=1 Tax=Caballeronia terrestris TaxID=1226301 RepID=A0A158L6U5_9BURK|nr:hypothetical protein AWB67_07645 [Caballeronia terrestris]
MAFEHGTTRNQADQAARAIGKCNVATDPGHIVGDIAEQPAALRDHVIVIPWEEFLEYGAAARKKPMDVAILWHALARSVCYWKRIAFEHGDGGIEIR